jgi:hypothetical protein
MTRRNGACPVKVELEVGAMTTTTNGSSRESIVADVRVAFVSVLCESAAHAM